MARAAALDQPTRSPADTNRRATAGLRTVFNIFDKLRITVDEGRVLLGGVSRSTYHRWKKAPESATVSRDLEERLHPGHLQGTADPCAGRTPTAAVPAPGEHLPALPRRDAAGRHAARPGLRPLPGPPLARRIAWLVTVSIPSPDELPLSLVEWPRSVRIISSRYPPVGVFDEVASAEDLEWVLELESQTNERIAEEAGDLSLVDPGDRIAGAGTTPIMAAFTHPRASRFSDGEVGVYYCAARAETAIAETVYHRERFLRRLFPRYFVTAAVLGLLASVLAVFGDELLVASIMGTNGLCFVAARALIPAINAAKDREDPAFARLHLVSVMLNMAGLVLAIAAVAVLGAA